MEPPSHTGGVNERRRSRSALRVLVADDDRDTVETLGAVLEAEGHVVYRVYSGAEVLPAVRLLRPDAVVLDISIPGISGYGVAQAIRHSFTDIRRPLMIAISGIWKQPADRQVAQQVGFDHYLVKPCDPRRVLELLSRIRKAEGAIDNPGALNP